MNYISIKISQKKFETVLNSYIDDQFLNYIYYQKT